MSRFRRRLMGLAALRQAKADDFVRVEYIENTSTAYIQTNIIPNAQTGLKTKAYFTDSRDVYFVGLRNDGGNTRWGIGHGGAGFYYCYGNYQGTNRLVDTKGEFYLNYKNDKKFITIDLDDSSTLTSNLPNLSFTPKFGIRIFGAAGNGANTIVKSRIYYLQITQGSEIIRDFIPMYQISTDTYGLWDRVNEEFYTSPNGVKFIGGERVIADADDNIYYLKDYVVARGYYSFADTGIKGNSNDLLKMSLMVTSRPSTSYCWLIGYSYSETNRFGIYWKNSGNGFKWCVDFWRGSGYSNRRASTIYPNPNQRYDLIVGNPSTTQNNLSYMEDIRTNTVIFPEAEINPIGSSMSYVVSENRSSKANYYVRWYNLEIYKTMSGKKELVLHWIPVQRCSDGVWGFFDKVKEDFHSSEGTEEFTGA